MAITRTSISQWPRSGERRHRSVIQRPVVTTDLMGGRTTTWTSFSTWYVKVTAIPFVITDTQATVLHDCEGLYRSDLEVGYRVLIENGDFELVLKILALENPDAKNRTLVAHCGNALATNQ
jgi:hypothetical protein